MHGAFSGQAGTCDGRKESLRLLQQARSTRGARGSPDRLGRGEGREEGEEGAPRAPRLLLLEPTWTRHRVTAFQKRFAAKRAKVAAPDSGCSPPALTVVDGEGDEELSHAHARGEVCLSAQLMMKIAGMIFEIHQIMEMRSQLVIERHGVSIACTECLLLLRSRTRTHTHAHGSSHRSIVPRLSRRPSRRGSRRVAPGRAGSRRVAPSRHRAPRGVYSLH
jgi:hypothetical protein